MEFVLATVPNTGRRMSVKTHIGPCPKKITTGDRNIHFKHREISSLKSALIKILQERLLKEELA